MVIYRCFIFQGELIFSTYIHLGMIRFKILYSFLFLHTVELLFTFMPFVKGFLFGYPWWKHCVFSVCPSRSCEVDISVTPRGGISFKSGTNIQLDSKKNWPKVKEVLQNMSCSLDGLKHWRSTFRQSSRYSLTFIFFSKLLFCSSLHLVLKLQQKINTNDSNICKSLFFTKETSDQ